MRFLEALLGVPPCSRDGCPWPGVFGFEFTDDDGPLTAFLCPACVPRAAELLREIAAFRKRQRLPFDGNGGEEEKEA
jgi:hypothetical protein